MAAVKARTKARDAAAAKVIDATAGARAEEEANAKARHSCPTVVVEAVKEELRMVAVPLVNGIEMTSAPRKGQQPPAAAAPPQPSNARGRGKA
eukprot:1919145-Pyramimonas_sp.AAC.1